MADLIGPWIMSGDTSIIDTAKKHELGTRASDADGNEYIYLQGVASTAAGSWVTFDEAHLTIRTVANALGRVAIAMAATVASTYGWYLIYGKSTTAVGSKTTTEDALFLSATPGVICGTDVAGDFVVGAIARSTVTSDQAFTVEISYPIVHNDAID